MFHGIIQKIMPEENFEDVVLIESPYKETTRKGHHLCSIYLALTSSNLVIASENELLEKNELNSMNYDFKLSMYPLETVNLKVFKHSRRQSLKASFKNNTTRYFELQLTNNRKIFWALWCKLIGEMHNKLKLWPFSTTTYSKEYWTNENMNRRNEKTNTQRWPKWTDKHLYLGSRRETEDKDRPLPVPGLGCTEDITLLYLKPQYFGCWEQIEHWVQCEKSNLEFTNQ